MTSIKYDATSKYNRNNYWNNKVEVEVGKSPRTSFRRSEPMNRNKESVIDDSESQVNVMNIEENRIKSNYDQYLY